MNLRIFIGWDSRFPEPGLVAAHSFRRHARRAVLDISFLDKRHLEDCYGFRPAADPRASTEFTRSRFLVPWLCGYEGRALFVDNDVLCLADVGELAALPLHGAALACVHHDYRPTAATKMYGAAQEAYPRKNWSSVMLMDCARLTCWTKDVVETAEPARLHRFQDVPDAQLGRLDPAWNVLDHMQPGRPVKLLHLTSGGPWSDPAKEWPHQDLWFAARREWLEATGQDPATPVRSPTG